MLPWYLHGSWLDDEFSDVVLPLAAVKKERGCAYLPLYLVRRVWKILLRAVNGLLWQNMLVMSSRRHAYPLLALSWDVNFA